MITQKVTFLFRTNVCRLSCKVLLNIAGGSCRITIFLVKLMQGHHLLPIHNILQKVRISLSYRMHTGPRRTRSAARSTLGNSLIFDMSNRLHVIVLQDIGDPGNDRWASCTVCFFEAFSHLGSFGIDVGSRDTIVFLG